MTTSNFSRITLATSKTYTEKKKAQAAAALASWSYRGQDLIDMQKIAEKGYFVRGNQIFTFWPSKTKKRSFIFAL